MYSINISRVLHGQACICDEDYVNTKIFIRVRDIFIFSEKLQ